MRLSNTILLPDVADCKHRVRGRETETEREIKRGEGETIEGEKIERDKERIERKNCDRERDAF